MELINKKHENITEKTRLRLEAYFKIENDRAVYFSAGAVINFGLVPDLFIHFQNDEDRWYFYCNSDTDGFKLCSLGGRGRNATLIWNKSLVNLILKRTLVSIGSKFPIKLTNCKFNNDHLLEINFKKPFEISKAPIMKKIQLKNSPVIARIDYSLYYPTKMEGII